MTSGNDNVTKITGTFKDVLFRCFIKVREYRRGNHKWTIQRMCVGHHYTQTNANDVKRTWTFYKQLEVKTKRTWLLCGNHNGHHNTEPRLLKYIIGFSMENLTKVVSPWESLLYIHVCMLVFSIPVKLLNITVKTPIALAIINNMHKVQC